ncbi:MAG: hypothetical protein IKW38_01110 [Kiritimatiellae bacterium]|nr:hypothetical protein [Kiritimatiellia bacterium]
MKISLYSFSYRRGLPNDPNGNGGGFVFDCRALPNPYWQEDIRKYNGQEAPVIDFFNQHKSAVDALLNPALALIKQAIHAYQADGRTSLYVAFGCTRGFHRSVYCAEQCAYHLRQDPTLEIHLHHTAL